MWPYRPHELIGGTNGPESTPGLRDGRARSRLCRPPGTPGRSFGVIFHGLNRLLGVRRFSAAGGQFLVGCRCLIPARASRIWGSSIDGRDLGVRLPSRKLRGRSRLSRWSSEFLPTPLTFRCHLDASRVVWRRSVTAFSGDALVAGNSSGARPGVSAAVPPPCCPVATHSRPRRAHRKLRIGAPGTRSAARRRSTRVRSADALAAVSPLVAGLDWFWAASDRKYFAGSFHCWPGRQERGQLSRQPAPHTPPDVFRSGLIHPRRS